MTALAKNIYKKTIHAVDFRNKLIELKLKSFQPKVRLHINVHGYTIKTAETIEELKDVLKLRHKVFIEEGLNKKKFLRVDFDRYDLLADHILLIESETLKTIGTYRLISSKYSKEFYSQNEFQLNSFLKSKGNKLELGRACIHPDYRNGISLNLIWKGLGAYSNSIQADYLFGCASVGVTSAAISLNLFKYLKTYQSSEFHIQPTEKYNFKEQDVDYLEQDYESLIPPLLRTYLKAGAFIHGRPALDKEFECIDFMTILNIQAMNEKFKNKYFHSNVNE